MVGAAAKRRAVRYAIDHHGLSQRSACRLLRQHRSTERYQSRRGDDQAIRERLKALAMQHRRYGYQRLHVLLRREGFGLNHKKTYRLYREEQLLVRRRNRRHRAATGRLPIPMPSSTTASHPTGTTS